MKAKDYPENFFRCEYLPNKLVYALSLNSGQVDVLFFCNEAGKGFRALKTTVPKTDLKRINSPYKASQTVLDCVEAFKANPLK